MKNVLFIGAHPDDIEIGAGGTLLRHIELGDNIFIIVVTDGEIGASRSVRLKELGASMKHAAVPDGNIFLLHLEDTMVFKNRKRLFDEIEQVCNDKNIHRVYTHTKKDYHQDHISIFGETIRAARNVPEILTYETNSSSLSTFSPNHFVDISDKIDAKMRLLQFHSSQACKTHLRPESVLAAAKFRGSQSRAFRCAEGFEVIRTVFCSGINGEEQSKQENVNNMQQEQNQGMNKDSTEKEDQDNAAAIETGTNPEDTKGVKDTENTGDTEVRQ